MTLAGPRRGELRVYLGAAPGVGKTFAMLAEGRRRRDRGTDVVVGFVETHGRARTAEQIGDLEVVPRRRIEYRGTQLTEMDLDAVLQRRPEVALVDELAHTNAPGSRHDKRWADVDELLAAGITVITTVNVQHLESVNDVVERITGIAQKETVPDAVVRRADQIELVDMTPEALRRRMVHGNIYPASKVDAALANYFREGNLAALRELALLWLADRVDEAVRRYQTEHDITALWETRERVVVALSGGPEGSTLIRRAARIAARGRAELLAVHVSRSDGLVSGSPVAIERQRELTTSLGGEFHLLTGDDIPRVLLEFARAEGATQLVLGVSRRSRLRRLLGAPGTATAVIQQSGPIDVHMVSHEYAGSTWQLPRLTSALSPRRRMIGFALAVLVPLLLTGLLTQVRAMVSFPSDLMLYLAAVVAVAMVGGLLPALLAAVLTSLLLNFYFTPPIHTFTISGRNNVIAVLMFIATAVSVSSVVDRSARRAGEAVRARAEAEALLALARSVLAAPRPVEALVRHAADTFGVAVRLEREDGEGWKPIAEGRPRAADVDGEGATGPGLVVPVGEGIRLVVDREQLPTADRRLLAAFATQASIVVQTERLRAEARRVRDLIEGNRMRTALLAAVSHDLRTPLATIKAAASSLRQTDVSWSPVDQAELLAAIEDAADRLHALVANLLDMSRVMTGGLRPLTRPVSLEEVVAAALDSLRATSQSAGGDRIRVEIPSTVPEVAADPGLLERALANVLGNALSYTPAHSPITVGASRLGDRVELRIVDRGPGLTDEAKRRCFEAFQRLGDVPKGTGLGLGLAVARGFLEAMGGVLQPEDTPGGGLTMVFSLRVATDAPGEPAAETPAALAW